MTPHFKRRANAAYEWMGENPATAILVSAGLSAGLTVLLFAALGLYSSATYVQKTACSKDPASKECADLRLEVAKAEPLRNPCASYQRVTSRRGRNCKHFYVPERRSQASSKNEVQNLQQGGDAQQTGSTGHQQPSPSPSGGGGNGTGAGKGGQTGGHEGGHAQGHPGDQNQAQTSPAPTSQADSGSASVDTGPDISRDIPPPANEAATPEPHPLPETVEAAGGAVEKTGEAAQGVVEGTGKAAGCVLRGSC